MKIISIIPARGNSKRIPGKNICTVGNEPMICWTIRSSLAAGIPTYVSTENRDITLITETTELNGLKAEVIKRPGELSQDDTPLEAVIEHALQSIECDAFLLLQPTSPLRGPTIIKKALAALEGGEFDSVVSLQHFPLAAFRWDVQHDGSCTQRMVNRPRTQDMAVTIENGALFGTTVEAWKKSKNRVSGRVYPLLMKQWESVDVDTLDDLQVANFWAVKQLMRRNPPM